MCDELSHRYRTPDGSCNNLGRAWWGAAYTPLGRLLGAAYLDGRQTPRVTDSNHALPAATAVTRLLPNCGQQLSALNNLFVALTQLVGNDVVHVAKARVHCDCDSAYLQASPECFNMPPFRASDGEQVRLWGRN